MPGLSAVLSIAEQSLLVQQSALQVTTNNIANANTPGDTRGRFWTSSRTLLTSKARSGMATV